MDFRTFIRRSLYPLRGAISSLFFCQGVRSTQSHKYICVRNFSCIRSQLPECPIKFSYFIPDSLSFLSNKESNGTSSTGENIILSADGDEMANGIIASSRLSTLSFVCGSSSWPHHHPERGLVKPTEQCSSYGSGDDAFLVTKGLLAVADGVGGWSTVPGANPSAYSRSLLDALYQFLLKGDLSSAIASTGPAQLLYDSVDKACLQVRHILGSSTLSFALLLRDDLLCLFNLGDSGIILMREGKCVLRSSPQCYQHNTPYQLGPKSKTRPSDGVVQLVAPKPGDLILLATDGLFDNMEEENILEKLATLSNNISNGLVQKNQVGSLLTTYSAQLLSEARKSFSASTGMRKTPVISTRRFQFGKPDDVTILIGLIVDQPFTAIPCT